MSSPEDVLSSQPPIPTSIGNYLLKSEIGSGAFSQVWRADHRITTTPVALKFFASQSFTSPEAEAHFIREVQLIKQLDHPFIAPQFELITIPDYHILVEEYLPRGSLLDLLQTHGRLPETHARRYFTQLIIALDYLHNDRMIVHRDLKAENVLLDRNLNIRLIDFGFSR
jgi:MAP/microtubule affinity-regulating kinase